MVTEFVMDSNSKVLLLAQLFVYTQNLGATIYFLGYADNFVRLQG